MYIDVENFFVASQGVFNLCDKPNRKPDFVSYNRKGHISSIYYYTKTSVIRISNHWGKVAKCKWAIPNVPLNAKKCHKLKESVCAEINFSELIPI